MSGTIADALRIVYPTRRGIRAAGHGLPQDVVVRATQGAVSGVRLARGNTLYLKK